MPRSPPSPAVCQSEGRSLVTLASIWRQGNKAHSRPYSGAGFGGWEGVAWASLESEDELGLRSRSRTELNYPKWSSGACNWEGQGGETSTRSKAEFSSQLNNLEPWRTQAGSQKSSFQTVPFAPYKVCGWAFKRNQVTQHHTSTHRASGSGSMVDEIFPLAILYSCSHFLESPFQS